MVDFKKLAEEHYNNATPEERERIDAYRAREARLNVTRRTIDATFTVLGTRHVDQGEGSRAKHELFPLKTTEKTIEMRIEDRTAFDGKPYEVIQFIGAVTGHEAFRLDDDFVEGLIKPAETTDEDIFSICWGSAKYDRCEVSKSAVAKYLKEMRPDLFVEAPAPAI